MATTSEKLDSRVKNLKGYKFGILTVTGLNGRTWSRHMTWNCECECGGSVVAVGSRLISGTVISCGCLQRGDHSNSRQNK